MRKLSSQASPVFGHGLSAMMHPNLYDPTPMSSYCKPKVDVQPYFTLRRCSYSYRHPLKHGFPELSSSNFLCHMPAINFVGSTYLLLRTSSWNQSGSCIKMMTPDQWKWRPGLIGKISTSKWQKKWHHFRCACFCIRPWLTLAMIAIVLYTGDSTIPACVVYF